ncbi:MAG: hemolysin family protein [Treponema sp.]|jgi:putative hemolysin|nr:hemolysin family protein [Treponema sp.]
MEDPPLSNILIILGLIAVGGLFSFSEMAVISARKSRLRGKADGDEKKYQKTLALLEKRSVLLPALQIAITAVCVFIGILGYLSFAAPLENLLISKGFSSFSADVLSIIIVIVLLIIFYVIFGEIIPKQAALSNPEKTCLHMASFLSVLLFLLTPPAFLFAFVSRTILSLFKIKAIREYTITEDELKSALDEGEKSGIVESEERTMVEGVFYLGDRPVANFMTHRSDIEWLDIDADLEEIKETAIRAKDQAYLPVASESLDKVIGVVLIQDIFIVLLENSWTGLENLVKPASIVPETMSALKAFESFKKGDDDYLFVMDEYGGFAGALSSRDLTEEIVGELSSRPEEEEEIIKQDDGSYLVDGITSIDDIAEILSITDLVGDSTNSSASGSARYHTLAGLILEIAGEIPHTGEVFEWNRFKFKVVDMDGNRIDKVIVYPPKT